MNRHRMAYHIAMNPFSCKQVPVRKTSQHVPTWPFYQTIMKRLQLQAMVNVIFWCDYSKIFNATKLLIVQRLARKGRLGSRQWTFQSELCWSRSCCTRWELECGVPAYPQIKRCIGCARVKECKRLSLSLSVAICQDWRMQKTAESLCAKGPALFVRSS